MNCCCESEEIKNLKIEGDVGADPIWCNQCGCNLDIRDVPVSIGLREELMSWAMMYGEWMDWEQDKLLPHEIELEKEFNQVGVILTEKVKQELGNTYEVTYSPSISVGIYT